VPEIDWLKVPPEEFDFLDFEEADRLLAAVDAEWRTMVLVALRTGMQGRGRGERQASSVDELMASPSQVSRNGHRRGQAAAGSGRRKSR
jgi:hypothetical protein